LLTETLRSGWVEFHRSTTFSMLGAHAQKLSSVGPSVAYSPPLPQAASRASPRPAATAFLAMSSRMGVSGRVSVASDCTGEDERCERAQ
jgi:hypothetical protein